MSYTYEYPRPAVTVDVVVYHLDKDDELNMLLIRRKQEPFAGHWALPGGFMDMDETPEVAVRRELKEETGIDAANFVQVGAFGALERDPRHRTISIAYLCILRGENQKVEGADDAAEARWFSLNELPKLLAFDHDLIIKCSKEKLEVRLKMAEADSQEAFGLSEQEIQQVLTLVAEQER